MVNLITTLKEVTKATRQEIMVIGLHKCSNQKRINAIYVRDFSLLNNTYIHTFDKAG